MIAALIGSSYLLRFSLGDSLLLSPVVLTVILIFAMQKGIPLSIRREIKKSWKPSGMAPPSMDDEVIKPLDTNPDSLDPANPFGRMSPGSPNYMFRSDRWDR